LGIPRAARTSTLEDSGPPVTSEAPGAPGAFQGMMVALPGGLGIGKLRGASDNRCSVEIFYSIAHQDQCEFDARELGRDYLSPQTRVYVRDGERFKVGRVTHYLR